MSNIILMWSKWADAYMQLTGWFNATIRRFPKDLERLRKIEHARLILAHWLSLLSALATDRFLQGDINRMVFRNRFALKVSGIRKCSSSRDLRRNFSHWSQLIVRREQLPRRFFSGGQNLTFDAFPLSDLLEAVNAEYQLAANSERRDNVIERPASYLSRRLTEAFVERQGRGSDRQKDALKKLKA